MSELERENGSSVQNGAKFMVDLPGDSEKGYVAMPR